MEEEAVAVGPRWARCGGCCWWMGGRLCGRVWAEEEAAGRKRTCRTKDRVDMGWFGEKTFLQLIFLFTSMCNNRGHA